MANEGCYGTAKSIYTLRCKRTGESQTVCVCQHHAKEMPIADGERVTAYVAFDPDLSCDFS